MGFGQAPTSQEIANTLRSEFGTGHPKIRLSLITYLMENKVRPSPDTVDEYITMVDKLVTWTAADAEEFFEAVAAMPEIEVKEDSPTTGNTETGLGGSYI